MHFDYVGYFNIRPPQPKQYVVNIMFMETSCYVIDSTGPPYVNTIIDFEEPNFAPLRDESEYVKNIGMVTKKLTICPFSAEYFNRIMGKRVATAVFYPTDITQITKTLGEAQMEDKTETALYIGVGGIGVAGIGNLRTIDELCARSTYPTPLEPTYLGKFKGLYKSKIALCINHLIYSESNMWMRNEIIQKMPDIIKDVVDDGVTLPQLKSRVFEAGFAKCIPLVLYDDYKLIETYFTPDVDFLYFHSMDELDALIERIVANYDDYKYIAMNAYNKCMANYTFEHFIERYILE
jgi:hypothetical protein